MEMEFLFCFSRLMLGTTKLKSQCLAVHNRLEGIKVAGYNLSFHSCPRNGCGWERLNKKLGHPLKDRQVRTATERTGEDMIILNPEAVLGSKNQTCSPVSSTQTVIIQYNQAIMILDGVENIRCF